MRWVATVELTAGAKARLVARATDGTGQPQANTFTLPAPDGASVWSAIQVTVD